MGILDRFKKTDLDLDVDEDELLREALGHKSKRKSKRKARKTKKTKRKTKYKKKKKAARKTKKATRRATPKAPARSEKARIRALEGKIKTLVREADHAKRENSKIKSSIKHDINNLKDTIKALETAVNPKAIHKIIANVTLSSKRLKEMEREDNTTLKTLHRIDKRISNIERRALDVESDYTHAQTSASALQKKSDDLKHTARIFMRQMDQFHSKTNAEFSKLVDMEQQLENMQQRLVQIEDVKLSSSAMENAISQNARTLSELARKLEYFERTSRKTIVLD